jgi:hypothetical protein
VATDDECGQQRIDSPCLAHDHLRDLTLDAAPDVSYISHALFSLWMLRRISRTSVTSGIPLMCCFLSI